MLKLTVNYSNSLTFHFQSNAYSWQKINGSIILKRTFHSMSSVKNSFKTFGPLFESLKYTKRVYDLSLPLYSLGKVTKKIKKRPLKSNTVVTKIAQLKSRINAIESKNLANTDSSVPKQTNGAFPLKAQSAQWPFRKKTKAEHYKRWKASRFYYRVVESKQNFKRTKRWSFIQYSHNRLNKFRLYYSTSTQNQFSHLLTKFNTLKKNVISHFLMLLEGRLEFFLFRINFAPTTYFARQLIRNKGVSVNNKLVLSRNHILKPHECVSISSNQFNVVFSSIKRRLLSNKILLNVPIYSEVDFVLLNAMLIKYPSPQEIILPLSMEYDLNNRKLHYVYNKI